MFFFSVYFSLYRPDHLNAWNRLSALSLLRPLFSVCRILEYQGAIIFISRIGRNVQARVLPFERAFLPTRVTAPAFLTEFAIEWTPRVGRTLVKLPTLPLSCKCRLLIHGETYLEVQWNPVNTYSELSDKKSRGH